MNNQYVHGEPDCKCLCVGGICENIKGVNPVDQKARDILAEIRLSLKKFDELDYGLIDEFTYRDILRILEDFLVETGEKHDSRYPSEPPNLP